MEVPSADEMSAIAFVTGALAGIVGGFWVLVTYRQSQRTGRAELINALYQQFTSSSRMLDAERRLKYEQDADFQRLLQNRVMRRDVELSASDIETLISVDLLLNFLDHIAFLRKSRLINEEEEFSMVYYWKYLILSPGNETLRAYIASEKFTQLASVLELEDSYFCEVSIGTIDKVRDLVPEEGDELRAFSCGKELLTQIDVRLESTGDAVRTIEKRGDTDVWLFRQADEKVETLRKSDRSVAKGRPTEPASGDDFGPRLPRTESSP